MNITELKKHVLQVIDSLSVDLREISLQIHSHPEISYEEKFASQLLSDHLKQAGFAIQRGIAELETAFVANLSGKKPGPTVAILAEYDALPDMGHACGHNLIAMASLGAALGLSTVMNEIDGSLMVVGCPAEEKGGGKIALVNSGIFNGISAAMMIHPRGETQLGRLILATTNMELTFHGKSSHAAAAPDKGINALDACIATFNGTNALMKHLRNDVRLHGIIIEGGTAANIVPERARAVFSVRARDRVYLELVIDKVKKCAEGGAMMAGATVDIVTAPVYAEMNFNQALSEAFAKNAVALGHRVLPLDTIHGGGSTDMGNVSQVIPSIHPFVKIGDSFLTPHTREFQQTACTDIAHQGMLDGAKMLAMTAIDLWKDAGLLRQIHEEFIRAR